MYKTNYISIFSLSVLFLLVLTSCEKHKVEDPLPEGKPVFTAQGTFGTEEFALGAGKGNCFMSTFLHEENGVMRYSGRLGSADFYVEMGVFQGDLDMTEPLSLENFQGSLAFAELPTEALVLLSKDQFGNAANMQEVNWYLDGTWAGVNEIEIMEPGKYEVCAEVKFYDQSISVLCNTLLVGYHLNASATVQHTISGQGVLNAWVSDYTEDVQSVKWFVDGENISSSMQLSTSISNSSHDVMAEITFSNGAIRQKRIVVDGASSNKHIGDFTTVEMGTSNQFNWDYKVVIRVVKDGKTYSTVDADNAKSEIELVDIVYFGKNSAGKDVYKCIGTVSANLKDEQSGELKEISFTTSFGLEMSE